MESVCGGIGPLIALAVSTLKALPRVGPWVRAHAKLTAALLAAVATFIATGFEATDPLAWVVCVLRELASAIATYELALKPAGRVLRAP